MPDAGIVNRSPSAEFMKLVDVDHLSDFDQVAEFLTTHLDQIISEVHSFDKLLIDNQKTQLNCPPSQEKEDGHLLIKTLSDTMSPCGGITLQREFKVHDMGPVDQENPEIRRVEIREEVIQAENGAPKYVENVRVVNISRP